MRRRPGHDIQGRARSLGAGVTVRRLLPSGARRMVGPFIFFDHMGPVGMASGEGFDVRPHPHINLATVTYLFDGEILHRDSLGSEQAIRPGAVNWMTAGRGIAHSERSPAAQRKAGPGLHGLQLWVALPQAHEQIEPSFHHHSADVIPTVERKDVRARVIAGSAYGATSPVQVLSPLFYVDAEIDKGGERLLGKRVEESPFAPVCYDSIRSDWMEQSRIGDGLLAIVVSDGDRLPPSCRQAHLAAGLGSGRPRNQP